MGWGVEAQPYPLLHHPAHISFTLSSYYLSFPYVSMFLNHDRPIDVLLCTLNLDCISCILDSFLSLVCEHDGPIRYVKRCFKWSCSESGWLFRLGLSLVIDVWQHLFSPYHFFCMMNTMCMAIKNAWMLGNQVPLTGSVWWPLDGVTMMFSWESGFTYVWLKL